MPPLPTKRQQAADWYAPEYLEYCGGRPPCEQMLLDSFIWPGGKMAGYIIWRSQKLAKAR